MPRLPRKNDARSIRARQDALGLDGQVTALDLAPFARAAEAVTGVAVHPVSVARGALAAGTFRTYVLADRITRASCFVCASAEDAVALARWIEDELPAM